MKLLKKILGTSDSSNLEEVTQYIPSQRSSAEAIELLSDAARRPTSEEAINVSKKELISAAKSINYPIDDKSFKKIERVHEAILPVIETWMGSILKDNEDSLPDYFPLARDGEILYDALWGIGQAGENSLAGRIHYLKTSTGMMPKDVDPEYFWGMGITPDRKENGTLMVLLDSGFAGSLFHRIYDWTKLKGKLPSDNLKGYLMEHHGSTFLQPDFGGEIWNSDEIYKSMENSPYESFTNRRLRKGVVAFMQLMPKFTGRFVQTYQRADGVWDVAPEKSSLASKLNFNSNEVCAENRSWDQNEYIGRRCGHINEDIVNPLASILLQKATIDYFSDPNIHDRVYDRVKKK